MPVYQCGTQKGALDADQRERIAKGITEIHSSETQAPEPFIRVLFSEFPEGYSYTAGRVEPSVVVSGSIRMGRPQETREAILRRIHELVLDVTGVKPGEVVLAALDLPSAWLMEAGFIMPEPTPEAEAEWFEKVKESGAVPA